MKAGTGDKASHEVAGVQITRSGRFLRKSKLDELPQIFCILKGDMSFVGPRPCLPSQEELINYRDRLGVFDVKPGITGPAQIAGIDMSTPDRLATADAEYLLMKSLVYDIRILAATVMRGFGLDAASSNSNSAKD
jgi:lipopolysaccharide/colanic/teichoic acid biosynthesis glycosyltransferase